MEYAITSKLRGIERGWIIVGNDIEYGKKCSKCAEMKLLSDYTPSKELYDGKMNVCKPCNAKRVGAYAKANPEIRRKSERKWRDKNPQKVKEMSKRSMERHPEGYARRLREFHERNPHARSVYHSRRRALIEELPNNFSHEWSKALLELYGGCILTGEQEGLHWDHFIPLATGKGGSTFGNMIPLKASLNQKKHAGNPIDFLINEGMSESNLHGVLYTLAKFNQMTVEEYIGYVDGCFIDKEA